jgi:Uma2 family endonuclease
MSTFNPPESGVRPDPFQYGWRYVRTRRPDGTEELEQVPLTLLDVLHPQEEDQILENSRHERLCRYFHDVFEQRFARQPTLLSLSDCRIDWDRPDLRAHGPDLIVLERDEPWAWRSWGTLHVKQERARPRLIIEVTSESTRQNDVGPKVEHYHRAGVPLYVIVDEETEGGPLSLVGYRYEPKGYVPLPLDDHGRLHLEPFGLYLVLKGDRAALVDSATGKEQGDYLAVCEALEAAVRSQQAAEARERMEFEARRAVERARVEAEQGLQVAEKARAEAERQRREEAEARQAAEQARREAETQAAQAAARLKQLQEELQRLRGS